MDSMLIVTKLDKDTKTIVDVISSPKVLVMEYKNKNALISDAKIGIAFEYGSNNNPLTCEWIVRDIKKVLHHLHMTASERSDEMKQNTTYYRVFGVLPKTSGMELDTNIKNYTSVTKGQHIGTHAGKPIYAVEDFVPILFGENRYKDIFGFLGEKL